MAFHDVRLPEEVERGSIGGPGFDTTVAPLTNGFEQRNENWEQTRGEWDISYGIQYKDDFQAVVDFFYVRRGRAHSFRFKDWMDYQIVGPQPIGDGDGVETVFQIYKRYEDSAGVFDRTIERPVFGTVQVYLDGVLQVSGYVVNHLTGEITFTPAVGNGVEVSVACEFDVPVRFNDDRLKVSWETFEAGEIPALVVIEVRGE